MTKPDSKPALSRRHLFAGAGSVGALAAVAAALPLVREAEPVARAVTPEPAEASGYQLTEHVRRYYQTTKI